MKTIKNILSFQKIILLAWCFFMFISSVNAQITTYIDPDISMLPASASISWAWPNDPIAANVASREQFCTELWGTYISYNSTANFQVNRARYFEGSWQLQWGSRNIASEIVCDIPVTNPWNPTWTTLTGTLAFMNFNPTNWDYNISEDFLIGLIVRVVLALMFFTLMWKFTRYFWKLGSFLSPYAKLWRK